MKQVRVVVTPITSERATHFRIENHSPEPFGNIEPPQELFPTIERALTVAIRFRRELEAQAAPSAATS